jgi:hypothetical protein
MTLGEVAESHGISVDAARARLGLPPEVAADDRLGRLSAEYGFTMREARAKLGGPRAKAPEAAE